MWQDSCRGFWQFPAVQFRNRAHRQSLHQACLAELYASFHKSRPRSSTIGLCGSVIELCYVGVALQSWRWCIQMAAAPDMTIGEAKAAVRAWVTGGDDRRLADLADGTVLCQVTHSNLKQNIIELRFDLHSTVAAAKDMLYTYSGTNLDYMELQIFSGDTLVRRFRLGH